MIETCHFVFIVMVFICALINLKKKRIKKYFETKQIFSKKTNKLSGRETRQGKERDKKSNIFAYDNALYAMCT